MTEQSAREAVLELFNDSLEAENLISRLESAEARVVKAEDALFDLVGQIIQARDGMGVYADSPSMAESLTRAQQLLEARHVDM